jgi:flavin-dependent dehydrogenase
MSLAKQAQKAGADYLFRAIVTDIISQPDAVKVKIDSQGQETIYKARVAIIATGFGSTLPRKLGLGEIKHFVLGAQAEVYINGVNEVEVYFDRSLAPGGFAWLVPTREGKGLAGLLTRHQPDSYLRNFLNTLSSHGKLISTEVVPRYGIIPLRPLPRTYADRILVVGEAAGQVKPTTGGGIYYGLLCADIAAEVLHQAFLTGDFSSSRLSAYQKQWRALLGRELQIGHWARWVYSRLSNRSIDHLFHIAAQNGIADFVTTKDFSFDWHSRLILQAARHLLPFPKPQKRL